MINSLVTPLNINEKVLGLHLAAEQIHIMQKKKICREAELDLSCKQTSFFFYLYLF